MVRMIDMFPEAVRKKLDLDNDISLLKENLKRLPIATDLEMSKDNFNSLLPEIAEDERDSFICLMSMILNGSFEKDEKSKE